MAVGAVNGLSASANSSGFSSGVTGELQDQFMKIMLTQLRYQDPMEPLKEQEFLAQMAQFSSATQIGELRQTVSQAMEWLVVSQSNQNLLSAARLIGNTFKAEVGQYVVEGAIESVCFDSGRLMVRSGEYLIPMENLFFIGGPVQEPTEGQVQGDATQGS